MPQTPAGLISAASRDLHLPDEHTEQARERSIRVLTDAYAYDIISESEFEARLTQLMAARQSSEIDALVVDLAGRDALAAVHPATPVTMKGRLFALMSETRRRGPWRVPQQLQLRAIMSDVKLDLRHAAIPPGCEIHVKAIMANVQIIVAPDTVVSFDVSPIMASAHSDADQMPRTISTPHIIVHGSAIMSEVRVRVKSLAR